MAGNLFPFHHMKRGSLVNKMQFGVFVPQGWKMDLVSIDDPVGQFEAMTAVGKAADAGPWDSIWVFDHFHTVPEPTMNSVFESWTITATLARDTQRIKIGQMVNCHGYRNPALSAKIASTIDVASHGRLLCGYGAGWYEHEWRAYGYGFPDTKDRMAAFREGVEILHRMWTEDAPVVNGRYHHIHQPINEPKSHTPGYKIPLWIGGGGPQVTLKLVAKYGDACNVWADVAKEKLAILRDHCDKLGRNYDEITKSSGIDCYPIPEGADPEQATRFVREKYGNISLDEFRKMGVVETPSQLIERVSRMQASGIDYIIVWINGLAYDMAPMHLFEEEVISKFQ